jgi:hypothetical protein
LNTCINAALILQFRTGSVLLLTFQDKRDDKHAPDPSIS